MKQLSMFQEIVVDNFAGGGGASTGIEMAMGKSVDIAINHDPAAIAMHRANHPETEHYCENVWEIDPVAACGDRKVALAWFSPDCKHFSKAKGGKPVEKSIRGLAWVAIRWAKMVRPRVIMLENVEEFKTWGPLMEDSKPDPRFKGRTFRHFVHALKRYGYTVDWRELRACDYGAPTIRKRFFLIARCDGQPIKWPQATHGDPDSLAVQTGKIQPWRSAGEIIDWSIECKSIFEREKPLCENTMKRIARGLKKFVIDNPKPYIVNDKAAMLIQYHGEQSDRETRGQTLKNPLLVIDSSNRYGLVAAFLSKYYAGGYTGAGSDVKDPLHTVTAVDHNAVVAAYIMHYYDTSIGVAPDEPLGTITAQGQHIAAVKAFLVKYYGQGEGQGLSEPLHTITTRDRFGIVTVKGIAYQIIDIGMRMLTPRELFNAQGFPTDYIIEKDADGNIYPKTAQVARCGNAVPPPFAEALVRENLPELCDKKKYTERTAVG